MAAISTSTYGSGQIVSIAMTGAINLRASHTFAIRVKNSSTATNYDSIVAGYTGTTVTFNPQGSAFGRNNGVASTAFNVYRINDSLFPTGDAAARSTCYGNTNTWYHCCFVYNASTQRIRFYIDGVYIGETASNTTRTGSVTSTTFGIGAHPGKFADAALYNRALSDAEVADLAAYRVPQVTSGLYLFWRLDSNATDSSGNGRNGSVTGSGSSITWSTADNPPQPETPILNIAGNAATASALSGSLTKAYAVAGAAHTASAFGGTLTVSKALQGAAHSGSALSGAVNVIKPLAGHAATASALDAWIRPRWGRRLQPTGSGVLRTFSAAIPTASAWTLMLWRRTIVSGDASIWLWSSAGHPAVVLGSFGGVAIRVYASSGGGSVIQHLGTDDLDWHHLAATYDGTTISLYVDGALANSDAIALPSDTFTSIQAWATGGAYMEIAHAKLWTAALTAGEIASEATYFTPHNQLADLYGWWQLSWQNVTLDSSGNGQTLTDASSIEAQTESPGVPMFLLEADAASASALSGTLSQAQPLLGAAHTASSLAAALTVTVALAGSAASASALAGQLSQQQPLEGDAASASAFAGTLAQVVGLAGDAASASSFGGALVQSVGLDGGAASASAFGGALTVHKPLEGHAATGSALGGILGVTGTFEGHAHTGSVFEGTLGVLRQVAGDAATASAFGGALSQLQPLGGHAASASAFGATLTVGELRPLAGDAASASALSGELAVSVALAGQAASASELGGSLTVTLALAGAAHTASAFAGSVSLVQHLAGAAHSASALSGTLTAQNNLAGNAHTASALGGTLNVDVIWHLSGAAWSASYLTGTLRVTHPAAARGGNTTTASAQALYGPDVIRSPGISRRWPPKY